MGALWRERRVRFDFNRERIVAELDRIVVLDRILLADRGLDHDHGHGLRGRTMPFRMRTCKRGRGRGAMGQLRPLHAMRRGRRRWMADGRTGDWEGVALQTANFNCQQTSGEKDSNAAFRAHREVALAVEGDALRDRTPKEGCAGDARAAAAGCRSRVRASERHRLACWANRLKGQQLADAQADTMERLRQRGWHCGMRRRPVVGECWPSGDRDRMVDRMVDKNGRPWDLCGAGGTAS